MTKWYETLGKTIKSRRKALELTQLELAEFSGCGVAYVHLLESGKPGLRLDKLLNVFSVLGLEFHLQAGKQKITFDKELS